MTNPIFPWLPVDFEVGKNARIRRVLNEGPCRESPVYQICSTKGGYGCLFLMKSSMSPDEVEAVKTDLNADFNLMEFNDKSFWAAVFSEDNAPMRIADIPTRNDFSSSTQLLGLAESLAKIKDHSWRESLYFPAARGVIPFGKAETIEEKKILAVSLLTGGIEDVGLSPQQIHAINRWLTAVQIRKFYRILNLSDNTEKKSVTPRPPEEFILPGQPKLEKFFRNVIDYYCRQEAYQKMGVHPVRGILLHGKPGVGKTYSVRKLAEFLEWEMIEINLSSIGSKYIHETSARIRRKFDEARQKSPAIIFLDEIDAIGGAREMSGHDHKIEEVNELLKQVEKAGQDGLLVIAATNFLDALDEALRRKGRFDLDINIHFPETPEILAALKHCLSNRPCEAGLFLDPIAKRLEGYSFADVDWLANKAGDIAVKSDKSQIDQECLEQAIQNFPSIRDRDSKYIL